MGYEKGETGNSQGQIRRKPIRDALDALMSRTADDPLADRPKTIAQKIAIELVKDASSPNDKIRLSARTELIDRTDGKAIQALEHSGHIARTHEEELETLDNPAMDDTAREGDTNSA
jgi:D-alanyl-D-alanine dipeptidase